MVEPIIRVGMPPEAVDFELCGEYETIREGKDKVIYLPSTPESRCILKNVDYGIGFHWANKMDFILPGAIEVGAEGEIINRVGIEDYIKCVISSEMSADCPPEFLKAHAVISRSWALRRISENRCDSVQGRRNGKQIICWEDSESHSGFDVCPDDHCQRYQGVGGIKPDVVKAVEATRGIVLTDKDEKIIDARFSKCCGGKTELFSSCWQDEDFDYLESFHDPYCNPSHLSVQQSESLRKIIFKEYDKTTEYFEWDETVNSSEISENLAQKFGVRIGSVMNIVPIQRGASGRITELLIQGSEGEISIGKELAIRRILSSTTVKSSMFEIDKTGENRYILHGRGWGHGVGLCQVGGAVMALSGKTYSEILGFYYHNTRLQKLY